MSKIVKCDTCGKTDEQSGVSFVVTVENECSGIRYQDSCAHFLSGDYCSIECISKRISGYAIDGFAGNVDAGCVGGNSDNALREELCRVWSIIKSSSRMGADKDEPEGARYIQISDTLASNIAHEIYVLLEGRDESSE